MKTRQGKVFTGNKETILICFGFDVVSDTVEIQAPQFDRLRVVAGRQKGKIKGRVFKKDIQCLQAKHDLTNLLLSLTTTLRKALICCITQESC